MRRGLGNTLARRIIAVTLSVAVLLTLGIAAAWAGAEVKWTRNGIPMTRLAGDNDAQQVIADGNGGAIVLFLPPQGTPYAQRVDKDGNLLWGNNGVDLFSGISRISKSYHAIPDGNSGAYIACATNTGEIMGQHVNAAGNLPWGNAGVFLHQGSYSSVGPRMCPDGKGGFIASWQNQRTNASTYDVLAQRVNPAGVTQWNAAPGGGNYVCQLGGSDQVKVQVVPGLSDDAIVAWQDDRNGDDYVYAQRVDEFGATKWGANDVRLGKGGWSEHALSGICTDDAGGAIVAFEGTGATGSPDIRAQRVSVSGAVEWGTDGIAVCDADEAQWSPQIATNGQGGAFVAWDDYRTTYEDVYCQKVDQNGNLLWTADGFQVTNAPDSQREVRVVADGLNGVMLTWMDSRYGKDYEVYAQRLTDSGGEAWTAGGFRVCSRDNGYCEPVIARTAQGDAIIAWRDTRNTGTSGYDTYAQRVVSTGQPIPDKWYFAEGTTRAGFDQYISIQNSNAAASDVKITYMLEGGQIREQTLDVPGRTRSTVTVAGFLGVGVDNSAVVESTNNVPVVAERPMYFDYGQDHGLSWPGGHDVVGSNQTLDTWYFAEGTTRDGFEQYICLQNPGDVEAEVSITYMLENSATRVQNVDVGAKARVTVPVHDFLGAGFDNSALVEVTNGVEIVAERPQYFDYGQAQGLSWPGGHCVIGTDAPAEHWYFAEGTTRDGFEQYICLQNPSQQEAEVKITYMMEAGATEEQTKNVPPESRLTVVVNDFLGAEVDNSAHVETTNGVEIVAERPMYFDYGRNQGLSWPGGHDVVGSKVARQTWYFAEGTTRAGFDEFICLQNPNQNKTTALLTYMLDDGDNFMEAYNLPGNSRVTVNVRDYVLEGHDVSIRAESSDGTKIIVERPMYFDYNEVWPGGHDVLGY